MKKDKVRKSLNIKKSRAAGVPVNFALGVKSCGAKTQARSHMLEIPIFEKPYNARLSVKKGPKFFRISREGIDDLCQIAIGKGKTTFLQPP
jgi:hypothetical protein